MPALAFSVQTEPNSCTQLFCICATEVGPLTCRFESKTFIVSCRPLLSVGVPNHALLSNPMITGYNTDVRHGERSFHVQTEDKGSSNPTVESLIYVGGQVVAAKRTSYSDLLDDPSAETKLIELMDHQHRTMISAIRQGRFDEKVWEMLGGPPPPPPPAAAGTEAAAIESAPGAPGADKSLDEVILDYLTSESKQERLVLQLEDEVELAFGEKTPLSVRTNLSRSGTPVEGAEVLVKLISTIEEPKVLGFGLTDDDGLLQLALNLPEITAGNSALIITASGDQGRAELKYLL